MANFAFKGRKQNGDLVQGVLESVSAGGVAEYLRELGVTPVEIKPGQARASSDDGDDVLARFFPDKVEAQDVLLFCRHMYTLLKAGVPIMSALSGLRDSASNSAFRKMLGEIRESLEGGRELSAALVRHPDSFSPFFVAMVRVGEMTGRLDAIFLRLFKFLDFERLMREQVKAALRYPIFVVAVMVIAIVIINLFVIPPFAKVYQGFNAKLPYMTMLLIGFSDFMVAYWWLMLGAALAALFGFRAWTATKAGELRWDELKLRIPISGKILEKAALARYARSFALAARSGVPIVQAMTLVAATVGNAYMADKVDRMREGIERGESVHRTATISGIFTPMVLQMVAVGEESGSLDDLMEEVADMYQGDIEYDLKNLGSQIEPVLIIFLGVLVLILALGVFLPIWDLGTAATGRGGQ
jgi:MSHA biogenesis protein MshG